MHSLLLCQHATAVSMQDGMPLKDAAWVLRRVVKLPSRPIRNRAWCLVGGVMPCGSTTTYTITLVQKPGEILHTTGWFLLSCNSSTVCMHAVLEALQQRVLQDSAEKHPQHYALHTKLLGVFSVPLHAWVGARTPPLCRVMLMPIT